jgi:hypothetical protein
VPATPKVKPDELAEFAREALYVTVGLGILGFQKLQAQRRALERRLSSRDAGGATSSEAGAS